MPESNRTRRCRRARDGAGRAWLRLVIAALFAGTLSACISLPTIDPASAVDVERAERATRLNPKNAHAWFLQGRAALDEHRWLDAEAAFKRALAAQPEFEEASLGLALSQLERRRLSEARSTYAALAQRRPGSVGALEGLATVSLLEDKLDAAKEYAEAALALRATAPQAHRVLGDVAYTRGDYAKALEHWDIAADNDPAQALALNPIIADLTQYRQKYGP